MDKKALKKFLIETKKAGYGAGDSKKWIKEKDGSTTIPFKSGDFRMHDNFFGGEPWGGREVVFYKEKPVWMMVMYGSIDSSFNDFETVYKFLKKHSEISRKTFPFVVQNCFGKAILSTKIRPKGILKSFLEKKRFIKIKNEFIK